MKKIETVEQLVENHLPNAHSRCDTWAKSEIARTGVQWVYPPPDYFAEFCRIAFAEALANYSKELCEEQRFICVERACKAKAPKEVVNAVCEAPMPKFEPIKGER